MSNTQSNQDIKKQKNQTKDYIFAVGRRREAVARVRLYEHIKDGLVFGDRVVHKGDILVNGLPITEYFKNLTSRYEFSEPLRVTNTQNKYTFTIKVEGGGKSSQLDAVTHGIARALAKLDPQHYRSILKKKGFLTRDARVKERRKVGTGGKARRKKQSPKR